MNKLSLASLAKELQSLDNFIVTAHVSPDADAVSSAVVLGSCLKKIGKNVKVFFNDPIPEKLNHLSYLVSEFLLEKLPEDLSNYSLVAVDTATKERIGKCFEPHEKSFVKVFNIDHHFTNTLWGDFNYIDAKASASAEIIFMFSQELKLNLNLEEANLLYAGILDDTGRFSFSNTTERVLEIASKVIGFGAKPDFVAEALYFSENMEVVKFKAEAVSDIKIEFDGKVAVIIVNSNLLKKHGLSAEDTEGLVDKARSIDGVLCAVLMREDVDHWKFSLRSKNKNFNVDKIAATFGGGGHKQAAGFRKRGSQEEVYNALINEIAQHLN